MRARTVGLAVTALVSLGLAGTLAPSLREQRRAALGEGVGPPPADVAIAATALGAFRGLVVDYLWLRAMRLEDEGKFFEALELARWICKLQPRLEQVWSFQAHGLAYNMSAAVDDGAQRWRWIEAGIELLRDRGIPQNPGSPELYFMLSRIYSDKIGGPFDDYQKQLKQSLALSLEPGFGPFGGDPDLEGIAAGKYPERTAWLAEHKLDPRKILEVEKTYGPLEWHGCDAHSLYWAVEGERAARKLGPNRAKREERRLERLAINSVKNAMRRGRLIVEPDGNVYSVPEPRLARRTLDLYDEAIARAKEAEERGEKIWKEEADQDDDDGHHHDGSGIIQSEWGVAAYRYSLEDARKDFSLEAIFLLSQYGREADARLVFDHLAKHNPEVVDKPYEAFVTEILVMQVLGKDVPTLNSMNQLLMGTWTRAWRALARGDDEQALGLMSLADRAYREWKKFVEKAVAEGDPKAIQRLGTVSLRTIMERALDDARKGFSPLLQKRLEERAPGLMNARAPARPEGEK
jgi:tetratricopeptide (TPR) repeat protein